MNSPAPMSSNNASEPLDLAALGQTWAPPQAMDTTPEVSDIIAEMPWWAAKGPVTETLDRQNRLAQLKSEMAALELAISQTTIIAPIGGVITKLDLRSPREVVQAGQQIAAIAPTGARLLIEAQVPNKDIGLIEKGLPAKLKFDAFPFQDYGSVPGTVIEVSPDAQVDERLGSFYKVMIAPQRTEIVAKGKTIQLRPGLTLTVEVITERKNVLSLILEPFRKLKGETGSAK